jgi:tripeptidyl-peptidase I
MEVLIVPILDMAQIHTIVLDLILFFVSTSPYVVSVGSTKPSDGTDVSVGFSGGGFSDYFPQPQYQANAVNAFFDQSHNIPSTSYFNKNGRGFPDVAVVEVNFLVFWRGVLTPVDGTSASTLAFAAMISMVNTLHFNSGFQSLGFLNSFLYESWAQNVGAFHDVIKGHTQSHGCCSAGFSPVQGWEPFCGLGTSDYGVLSQLALSDQMFPSFSILLSKILLWY